MNEENTSLSIGLFASNRRLQALLRVLLSMAGYCVTVCGKQRQSLAAFLDEVLACLQQTKTPPYDLLILEVAATEVVGQVHSCLAQVANSRVLPIIVLTDPSELELWQMNVTVVPVVFQDLLHVPTLFRAIERTTGTALPLSESLLWNVLQSQREQYQVLIRAEQARIDQRREWSAQRQEWIDQQREWLQSRLAWLDVQMKRPDPQREWLSELRAWVQPQLEELHRQQQWLLDHQCLLHTSQKRLDYIKQQALSPDAWCRDGG